MRYLRTVAFVLAVGIASPENAAAQTRAGRVALETVSSGAVAVGGALVVGLLGVSLNQEPGDRETVAAIVGAAVGTSLGAGLGAALGGHLAGAPTVIARPLMGAAMGSAAFFIMRQGLGLDPDYASFWIGWFALPVAGAVVAAELGLPRLPVSVGLAGDASVVVGIGLPVWRFPRP